MDPDLWIVLIVNGDVLVIDKQNVNWEIEEL